MDRPPPETDVSSAVLKLCEYIGAIFIEVSVSHMVESLISTSSIPPYILEPALIAIGTGILHFVQRRRQRKAKR